MAGYNFDDKPHFRQFGNDIPPKETRATKNCDDFSTEIWVKHFILRSSDLIFSPTTIIIYKNFSKGFYIFRTGSTQL